MEKAQIFAKFEEIVTSLGFLLIDVALRGDSNFRIVEIYIDNEKGITAEDCALVSRAINEAIGSGGIIDTNYRLDISSPGVDRPLKFLVQYQKHINRKFEVEYKEADAIKKLTGKLIRIENDSLFFEEKQKEVKIDFGSISRAKVIISF